MSNAEKFWTTLFVLFQIVLAFFNWQAALAVNSICGFLTFLSVMVGDDLPKAIHINWVAAIGIVLVFIIMGLIKLFEMTIGKFNTWLNSKDFSKCNPVKEKEVIGEETKEETNV